MKIVAISGSPRTAGNTGYLLDQALEEAKKLGVETERIDVAKYRINPCQGHDACGQFAFCVQKDDAPAILRRMFEADGVILASPVHYWNMTAQMKCLVDRAVFYRRHKQQLRAGVVGIMTVARGSGNELAQAALESFIKLSSKIPPERILRVGGLAGDMGEVEKNFQLIGQARQLGKDVAQALVG